MLRYQFVPVERQGDVLVVVMADPSNVLAVDEVELATGSPIEVKVGPARHIAEILEKSESTQRVLEEATEDFRIQLVQERENGEEALSIDRSRRHLPDHQARRLHRLQRHPAARLRHPHRDARRTRWSSSTASTASSTRRWSPSTSAPLDDHLAHQGHVRAGHRREAHPPGRPLQAAACRADHRLPRLDHADASTARTRHPHPGQGVDRTRVHAPEPRHPGVRRGDQAQLRKFIARAVRHGARHRAHRLGQDDHAVRRLSEISRARTRSSPSRTRSSTS